GINDPESNLNALADGLLVRWKQLLQTGAKVLVIRDTPRMSKNVPECMSGYGATIDGCSTPREKALRPDPIVLAMGRKPASWTDLYYMVLTNDICARSSCEPVQGQI